MATITTTTHKILDSAGNLANGYIYFRQSARYVTATALVTTAQGQVAVKNGEFARPLVIPATPVDEFVQIVEVFGPNPSTRQPVTWWTHVGALGTYEYTDLPVDVAPDGTPSFSWALNDLSDVDTATNPPSDGQALVYSTASAGWKPGTVSGGGGSTDPEVVRDTIAAALVAGTNVTITPNDVGDTITIAATAGSAPDATTSSKGVVQLAGDLAGTAAAPTVVAASATVAGKVELATTAETTTGTDTVRAVTPAGVQATRGLYVGVNAQTGTSYAPVLTDQGKLVTLTNAGAITVTLPQNTTTAFPVGTQIDFVVLGAGMATFAPGTGATVNGTPSLVTRAQYSAVTLIKISTNGWLAVGDLA